MFKRAIVRAPARNFADGLTSSSLGAPDFEKALAQHAAYCVALEACGLTLTQLEADLQHPDSAFVEDVAVLTPSTAVLTRPGAESRRGEVETLRAPLACFFPTVHEITAPGTLDGGDVCEAGSHFFIGISRRTNEEGARQLAKILNGEGCTTSLVDIRGMNNLLHLKSGISWLGEKSLAVTEEMADRKEFLGYSRVLVHKSEAYAADCLLVNGRILIPAGFPQIRASLEERGYSVVSLEMSEFEKMDGGLSCLSLRF